MIKEVKNYNDLHTAVTQMNAAVIQLCNAKTQEELQTSVTDAKDILVAIFKYKSGEVK